MTLTKDLAGKMAYRLGLGCFLFFFQLLNSNPLTIFHRGLWVRAMSIATPNSVHRVIDLAEKLQATDLYVQVVVGGYAYYKSEILPKSEYLVKNAPPDYEPLDSLLNMARKKNIRVHAWVNTLLIWSMDSIPDSTRHIHHSHPDWFLRDVFGRNMMDYTSVERQDFGVEGTFIDPGREEVRDFLRDICLEIVKKYKVAGIHLDFIRYPGVFWGIEDTMRAALILGLNNKDLRWLTLLRYPKLEFFERWIVYNMYLENKNRQRKISELVGQINCAIKKVSRDCVLSCAVVANPARAIYQYAQNWCEWKGVIDYPVVMSYTTDVSLFCDFLNYAMYNLPNAIMGIGLLWRGMEVQANAQKELARRTNGKGICYFDFASLDTMADLNMLMDSTLILPESVLQFSKNFVLTDTNSVFSEKAPEDWIREGVKYVRYGEDLDFARFLISLAVNPDQDFIKLGMKREDFLKYLQYDVASFEYLNRRLFLIDNKLLEPPKREIEYTFIKWNNGDSSVVREKARKLRRYEFKKMIYPEAMNPLVRAVFEAKKGEKKIIETRSGIYVFRIKEIKGCCEWIKKSKIKADFLPIYVHWTIKRKFNELYYNR